MRIFTPVLFIAITVGLVPTAQRVSAHTTNLIAAADASLRSSVPDQNLGSDAVGFAGVSDSGSPVNRTVLKFNLAAIPANATITSVTLTIKVTQTQRPPANFELHRLVVDWDETQVTWDSRLAGTPWDAGGGQPGTDFTAVLSASGVLGDSGSTGTFASADLVNEVQAWVANYTPNFGWLLLAAGEPAGTGKQIGSRENPGNEPVLTVDYTLPAPPTPPDIFGVALTGNKIRFSFNAQSNRTYAVEFRNSLTATNWSTLTNIPALPADGVVSITDTVTSVEKYFRARTP